MHRRLAHPRDAPCPRDCRLSPHPIPHIAHAQHTPRHCRIAGLSRSDPDSPSQYAEALLGREHNSKSLQQFLQHGGEVLRFYMLWDDRQSPFGMRTLYKLHYFVADSTVRRQRCAVLPPARCDPGGRRQHAMLEVWPRGAKSSTSYL